MLYFSLRDALNALRTSVRLKVPLSFTAFHRVSGDVPEYYWSHIPWVLLKCAHTICFRAKLRHDSYIHSKTQEGSFAKRQPCLLRHLSSVETSALDSLQLETRGRKSCFRWKKRDEVPTHVKDNISYWLFLVALHTAFWIFGPFTLKMFCCVHRLCRQVTRIAFWNQTSISWIFQPLS